MTFPLEADHLIRNIDLDATFQQAIDSAHLDNGQKRVVKLLKKDRSLDTLRAICKEMPARKFEAYDPNSLLSRARWKAGKLKRAVSELFGGKQARFLLEIGCGRGEMLGVLLEESGLVCCGLDLVDHWFVDNRKEFPILNNALLVKAPAEQMPFCSECFDLVFGYNSMEHFNDPHQVIDESLRVLKPGGYLYFYYGPPFNSPFGPHLHHRIGLPYFHHLFLREVVGKHLGVEAAKIYQGKNEWNTQQFRDLFIRDRRFECRMFVEEFTWDALWLVQQLPGDFEDFLPHELVVRAIEVVCQKNF